MKYDISNSLFEKAIKSIPGGVNSPVRAFKSVGRKPIFIKRADKAKIIDADNNEYIDYIGSWGPMLLGHNHPQVTMAVKEALNNGTSYGAPTEKEIILAELIIKMVPAIEMVRLVSSGTEATMSAIRLARAYTGKDKIIKFEGCYHGHADSFLIKAGSGLTTLGHPSSPGVTKNIAKDTLTAEFNNIESVKYLFDQNEGEIAAVIVEPIPANMGVVLPQGNFLNDLRKLTSDKKSVLIFDEVISGFRAAHGGAGELFNIKPDLVTLGKIIGGGFPIGAYGGKKDIMEQMAPSGPVYQAGTLSGNPIAVTAGIQTLKIIQQENIIAKIQGKADRLNKGTISLLSKYGLSYSINNISSFGTLFFTTQKVNNYQDALTSDTAKYAKFFNGMLDKGIYLAPSQFEAFFVSLAHTDEDIDRTLQAMSDVLRNF